MTIDDRQFSSQEPLLDDVFSLPRGAVVLMLGEADTGKSSLIRRAAADPRFRRRALLDTDVGQGDLGGPATIAAALHESGQPMSVLGRKFIGAVSPVRHLGELCDGARQLLLVLRRKDPDLVLVDTCGLVRGRIGVGFKSRLIGAVKPDVVVALSRSGELDPILNSITPAQLDPSTLNATRQPGVSHKTAIWSLPPPAAVRKKTAAYRRKMRVQRFAAAFVDASLVSLPFDRNSAPVAILREIAAHGHGYRHLLCGLIDAHGFCQAIALLDSIDIHSSSISVLTAASHPDSAVAIRLGDLRIAPNGSTIDELRWKPVEIPVSRAQPNSPNSR